ncbi:MAG: leucine-rich repeat protein [Oscillospiraceae bacterium]
MKKRILSILLAALMLLSALPLGMVDTAYAAALASGKCGDSATWTLDSTGTLTISGTGATYNYDMDDDGNSAAPWCTKARIQRVNKVVVNSGITELGYSMFSNCTQLTSVSLPSGLKRIGSCLFLGCTRLSAITIPSSVTTIESNAFTHCDSITAITLPSGLRTMGDAVCSQMAKLTTATVSGGVTYLSNYAFNDCPGLKTITLPNTVRSIGICAFRYDTALKDVYFNGSVTQWTSIQIAGEGNSALYNADVHCTGLTAPTVTGGNDAQGRPTLKWNAVTGAAKYEVYRARSLNGDYIKYSTVTGTSYTNISYIENGNTYYYKVRALKSDGTAGAWSSIVSVTYKQTLPAPTVTGGNDAQGRPTLTWKAVTGAAKYEVYRARSKDGDYIKYSTVTGTSYTNISYIENGNTYYYKVRALDANGTAGAWSSIVSVTYKQTLPAPTVTGGNDSQGRPTLKWNAVTGAAKYEVYRARSLNGDYIKYSTVTGTSYTNTSYIENGNTYYYKVRALKSDGTAGAWSSIVAVTYKQTLSAPAVTGGNDAQGRPTLKWNAVSGAAKYEVYRARSKNGDYIKYSTVTGTSYTNISYIENGNTYYYKVRALGSNGSYGPYSAVVSVTCRLKLPAPTVTGGNDAQGRPTLKWNAVSGAAKYEVYRARSKDGDYIKYSTVTGTSYTNTSYIENGNTYYYKVRALKSDGTAGAWSSVVSVTYRKPAAATVASGRCGDSAAWKLDAEGTLTISGTGATYDFFDDYNYTAPWYDAELRLQIKKAVVNKGITYLGSCAFRDCAELASVSLPTGLEKMGSSVFGYCESLTSVTIPAGVTAIGGDFFYGCASLNSVTLPDSLWDAGGCTFMDCASLTSVRLPANLGRITWRMFKDCTSLTSVTIPRGTVEVMKEAFDGCTSLKNVTFTGSAADWKGVTIRPGNTALTSAAIKCTGSTVLTAPTLTLSVSKKGQPTLKWSAVSGAAGYQLWYSYDGGENYGPKYYNYGNNGKTPTSLTIKTDYLKKGQTYTFKVRAVTSSGAVGSFSKEVTFTYNPAASLAAPTVTAGLDDQGYPALTWPAVPDAARYEVYRAASEDGDFTRLAAVASNSYTNSAVLTDGAAYYYKVRALDSDGEAGPFSDVVSVTYTARPALVASGKCGDSASWKLDADGVLTITGAGPMADYSQHASDNCAPWRTYANDIKKVVVQKGVTAIGSYAFASLERVISVTLPEGVTSIGSSAFENCGLMAYGGLGAVTLPEGLTTIGSSAFSGSYMDSLTLPESLRTIGGAAFEKSPLKTLTIPGGVTSIGNGAFKSSHLTSIQLPDGAQLGAMLFYQCYELTDVTLPADLTVIGDSMFENCTKLTHVTIPSGVTRIEREAFAMCGALEEIRLPEGVETIGVIAFSGCVAMTGAYLPRSLTTIESGAFSACRSLTDVYYGGTAAEWAAISVADRNDPLLNAALHCTGQSASRLDVPAMTLGEDCSDGKPTVWWPAVTGAERYEIWRAQAASDGSAPAASAYTLIVSADVTFHKDTTAEADTWYYYKVRAVSGSAYSDFSQAARRYCEAPPTMDTPEITSLELDDSGKPVLTWRTVEGAARYQVFRSEDNGFSYSPMGTVLPTGSDTITWTDTTAVSGIGYYYGVGCYDDNGHYSSFGSGEWWVTAR